MTRVYGPRSDPLEVMPKHLRVGHKQWEAIAPTIASFAPDVVVTFGTSIVPPDLVATARIATLNIHAGIAPCYRGMFCTEQALFRGDFANIGATVHRAEAKIDGGEIAMQARAQLEADDDEHVVHHRVLDLGHEVVVNLLEALRHGAGLKTAPQDLRSGRLYRARDFDRARRRELRRRVAKGLIRDFARADRLL